MSERDMYRPMFPAPSEQVLPCPLCGSDASVWEFSEKPSDPVQRVVMCSNGEALGPQDGMVNEGCLFYMPPDQFYRPTGRDAVGYWNEFTRAIEAQRRKRSWERHSALRSQP